MSSADGYPQFIPGPCDTAMLPLSDYLNRLVEEMIKQLTKDDTWDKMREDMQKHLEDASWEEQVEKRMSAIIQKPDLQNRPYVDILQELGGPSFEKDANPNVENLIEKLVTTMPFAMSDEMKRQFFKILHCSYPEELEDAYNSACTAIHAAAMKKEINNF